MRPRSPLQCYGHLLEQVGGLSLVTCDVCRPSSDLLDQFDGLMVPGSGRFDYYYYLFYCSLCLSFVLFYMDLEWSRV